MKQIIIFVMCLFLLGCTKSYQEVEAAREKCTNIGGTIVLIGAIGGDTTYGVTQVYCNVGGVRYPKGKF